FGGDVQRRGRGAGEGGAVEYRRGRDRRAARAAREIGHAHVRDGDGGAAARGELLPLHRTALVRGAHLEREIGEVVAGRELRRVRDVELQGAGADAGTRLLTVLFVL